MNVLKRDRVNVYLCVCVCVCVKEKERDVYPIPSILLSNYEDFPKDGAKFKCCEITRDYNCLKIVLL